MNSGRKDCALHNIGRDGRGNRVSETHLPAIERRLDFHPANLLFTLSMMKLKSCPEEPGYLRGNPKYLPKFEVASFIKNIMNSGKKDCALHNRGRDGRGNKVSENTSPSH